MGLEIVVLLVDVPSLRQLVTTPWCDLYSGLEKRTMRSIRPEQDSRLKVNFDIDAEAELLDWMDTQQRDSSETTSFWSCLQDSGDGEKGLLLAMKWASPGAWEAWEGRAYMYLDVALSKTIAGEEELYGGETWDGFVKHFGTFLSKNMLNAFAWIGWSAVRSWAKRWMRKKIHELFQPSKPTIEPQRPLFTP